MPTWRGRVLFTARLEVAARAPCLYAVVRGTSDSGYRHRYIVKVKLKKLKQLVDLKW
jgi:hypothetical protein